MRWLRWAAGTIAVVALLGLTAAAFVNGRDARGCIASLALPQTDIVGTVAAKDGGDVTFHIDQIVSDQQNPAPQPTSLEPGQDLVVRYSDGDARYLHRGASYRVPVFGNEIDGFHSGVHTADECDAPVGTGTVHADGTEINTGIFTLEGFQPYWPKLVITIVAITAITALIRWRIRVKHPRLTIDGHPLTKR